MRSMQCNDMVYKNCIKYSDCKLVTGNALLTVKLAETSISSAQLLSFT